MELIKWLYTPGGFSMVCSVLAISIAIKKFIEMYIKENNIPTIDENIQIFKDIEAKKIEESKKRAEFHKVKFYASSRAFGNDHNYFIVNEDGKVYKVLWKSGSRLFKHIVVTLDDIELACDEVDVSHVTVRSVLNAWELFKDRGYTNAVQSSS